MSELNYIANGDYLVPDLALNKEDIQPLGKYGRMRLTYLKEHRPIIFNSMLLSGKLMAHLHEIDESAQARLTQFMAIKPPEALKAADPLGWTAQMNSLKAQAEEVILAELIY